MQFGLVISKVAAVGCIAFLPVLYIGCGGADLDPAEQSAEAVGALDRGAPDNVGSPQSDSVPSDEDITVTCEDGGTCRGGCSNGIAGVQVGPNDFCNYDLSDAACLKGPPKSIRCSYVLRPGPHPKACPPTQTLNSGCV